MIFVGAALPGRPSAGTNPGVATEGHPYNCLKAQMMSAKLRSTRPKA
jgi:hypothetical protein